MKKIIVYVLTLVLTVCAAFVFVNRTNTFALHKGWGTTKAQLAKSVSTTIAFMTTRPALARGRLNLAAWNGYNEVYTREPMDAREIRFKLSMSPEGFVAVGLNGDDTGYDGLLLSPSYLYRNSFIQVNPSGEFMSREYLSPFHLEANREFYVRMVSDGGAVSVFVNEHLLYTLPVDFEPGKISFRGGEHPVFIDDIEVFGVDGQVLLNERFAHPHRRIILCCILLALLGMTFLISRYVSFFDIVTWQVTLIIIFIVYGLVDFNALAQRYPKYDGALRAQEESHLLQEEQRILQRVRDAADTEKMDGEYRILVLGSSQTWGSGILNDGDEFAVQWERRLHKQYPSRTINIINAGICGTTSDRLFGLYETEFIKTSPDAVVINLSNNDNGFDERTFVTFLRKFAALNKKRDIETVFILEPNGPEHRFYLPLHPVMRQVAEETQIPIWDANRYLIEQNDRGFLWWDWVHMSSFGHQLMARFLSDQWIQEGFLDE